MSVRTGSPQAQRAAADGSERRRAQGSHRNARQAATARPESWPSRGIERPRSFPRASPPKDIAERWATSETERELTQGWFVVKVRDAEWLFSEKRGARCAFESEYGDPPVEFDQFGINITVLEPGQTGLQRRVEPGGVPRAFRGVRAAGRGRGAPPGTLGLLPRSCVNRARLRGRGRGALCDRDGRFALG